MNTKIKELKRLARGNMTGNYTPLLRVYALTMGIAMLIELPFSMMQTQELLTTQNFIYLAAQFLIGVVTIVFLCGQYRVHLTLARTGQIEPMDFLYPLKNQPDRYILANLFLCLLQLVAMLPLLLGVGFAIYYDTLSWYLMAIPLCLLTLVLSVAVSLHFNLMFYLLLDYPDMTIPESMKKTLSMMRRNKLRLLYLYASFLGMYLLVLLSMGIAIFWIEPYMIQTLTLFYLDLTKEPS